MKKMLFSFSAVIALLLTFATMSHAANKKFDMNDYADALNEFTSSGGVTGQKCFEIGMEAAGEGLQLGGDVLGGIVKSVGQAIYGKDLLAKLGDHLGNIGLIFSAVQIVSDASQGKTREAKIGVLKMAWSYFMNKAVETIANPRNSAVLSASMVTVAIIDYSINKFATEAISGRKNIYRDAYKFYHSRGKPGHRTSADWNTIFLPLFEEGKLSEKDLKTKIDAIVTAHCNEFWNTNIDEYVIEVRGDMRGTGGQAGLNEATKKEISGEYRSILYREILPGVFYRIGEYLNQKNQEKLQIELKAFADFLDTKIEFLIIDEQKEYIGFPVRFSPLSPSETRWRGKLNSSGVSRGTYTILEHLQAGAPHTLNIFELGANPDKDKPKLSVPFTITLPQTTITLPKGDAPKKPSGPGWVLVEVKSNSKEWQRLIAENNSSRGKDMSSPTALRLSGSLSSNGVTGTALRTRYTKVITQEYKITWEMPKILKLNEDIAVKIDYQRIRDDAADPAPWSLNIEIMD